MDKTVRFDMRLILGKGGRGDESKSKSHPSGQPRESLRNKILRKLRSDSSSGPNPTFPRSVSRPEQRWSSRLPRPSSNAQSHSVWSTRSCGRPKSLADLKSVPLRNIKSEDSLKNDGAHGDTPAHHQHSYPRDDSSRQLNLLWEGEGGEESRSRLFSSLLNIENYDHD